MRSINRRAFLQQSAKASLALTLPAEIANALAKGPSIAAQDGMKAPIAKPDVPMLLPGTAPLTKQGDLAAEMVEGIRRFLEEKSVESPAGRRQFWNPDYSSQKAYEASVAPNRKRFQEIIGAVDPRSADTSPELIGELLAADPIAETPTYKAYAVRWHVLDPVAPDAGGLDAEGILLQPIDSPVCRVVAVPDADWTPEMLVGLADGVPASAQFGRRLAENRCQVLIPLLINRNDTFSGIPGVRMTNQPHREWIYRMAYEVGRHVIGFEVQKILAAIDWFQQQNQSHSLPIGVFGYGEGGLLALYSSAVDTRIDATVVSGYFQPREQVWQEPIYRDVWSLIKEFGDAELAALVAPRALVVEACKGPEVDGPPAATEVNTDVACPNGKLTTLNVDLVRKEVERARQFFVGLKNNDGLQLIVSDGGTGLPGSDIALKSFVRLMGVRTELRPALTPPTDRRANHDSLSQLHQQFDQMVGFAQALIRKSPERRKEFWAKADLAWPDSNDKAKQYYASLPQSGMEVWSASPQDWKEKTKWYRDYIWEEVIGRMPSPDLPANPRTRLIYETEKFQGYEVVLDVWKHVFAYGILLVPKNIKHGERRPVVVCQHGLEGRPQDAADPKVDSHYYHHFAATLAEQGFVTYAPQNPYIGKDHFRIIQRLGHPLKLALFSFVLGQHEQTLNWLAELAFVDPDRIGFYGLSYGGKTAVRVPPFLERYALSICSGDFNEWVWKTTSADSVSSYLLTPEYDMYEFNFANIVNYAELACLMAPRPFMVERGHYDPVSPDDTVEYEYAKVKWFYDYMGISDRTEIELFSGPHTIHGKGTFEFLHKHLRWPG